MKKYICILASAALFAACEQKTETVAPATATPAPVTTENHTTIVNPTPAETHTDTSTTTTTTSTPESTPMTTPNTTTESSTTTTTTESTATPNP